MKRTNICVRIDKSTANKIDLHSTINRITDSAWVRQACREKIARDQLKVESMHVDLKRQTLVKLQ